MSAVDRVVEECRSREDTAHRIAFELGVIAGGRGQGEYASLTPVELDGYDRLRTERPETSFPIDDTISEDRWMNIIERARNARKMMSEENI